ncbi:putative tail protein [Bacillus phage Shbh1]|uniref:Putative tail protein n=1 Tax=Bacillus phage Shbh1 TaxID=1796992 RepID=A0A142F1G0_9CAUD|nr:putative tail protein [Bacillus phage Shbh1]AMQ66617.1 putative tail protein [Bacillus phage Shbh1]
MANERINQGAPPYLDRFDPDKRRNKVLFRPDRALQQAELNELQSIAEYNLRQLGDSVFSDGSMQSGMEFSIDKQNQLLIVEDGLVYVEGKIRPFKRQSITFTGEGEENIGVRVIQKVIDYTEDPSLLDQTQGVDSYLSPGADRLEETVVLTYNDTSCPTIYQFTDGQLFIEPSRPDLSLINDVLATRTFEESGSYRVEGFEMWSEPSEATQENSILIIDSGIAYVMGYRINKPTSSRVPIRRSTDFFEVIHETHTYDTQKRDIKVGSTSVKRVTRVLARTESPAGGVQMSKGTQDGRDAVPSQYTSIARDTVTVWNNTQQFVRNTDYRIIEENGIQYVDWNTGLNGSEPPTGSTYFMSFDYDRRMTEGVDYQIRTEQHEGNSPGWDTWVDFNGMTGHKPKNGGLVSLDYEFYLARKDLVVLDRFGNFTVIEGEPDRLGVEEAPFQEDPFMLRIGMITAYPNSSMIRAVPNSINRLRMVDLQKMKSRLEDVEYNQAIMMLEIQATITDNPLDLRGVFADGFIDFDRMDKNLSSVAFSLEDASITLQVDAPQDKMKHPKLNDNSVAHVWGRLVTAPFIERREVNQPLASEAWNVNPYLVFNRQGVITLDPSADNWIETERVTVIQEDVKAVNLQRWWVWSNPNSQPIGRSRNEQKATGIVWDDGGSLHSFRGNTGDTRTGVIESSAEQTIDHTIDYMRQIDVNFKADNLLPNSNNLELTFDGIKVPITPTGGTAAGTTQGTVRSNAQGRCSGRFKIPKNIRTGTREVILRNSDNMAMTTFTANGIRRRVENTIFRTRVTATYYDPLAQSFIFNTDRVVTSVGLYFASKSTNENIIVQIRGLSEGGYPNRTIYAERTLTPDDIKISNDASVETKVALDDPLMAEAGKSYCVCIITDSSQYTMWVGTLGERLINNPNQFIETQPYVAGVLFSSSNAITWTAHQKSNLKFSIYTAEFQENATIVFDPMTGLDADMIMVMANYLTPSNTGCEWEVRVVNEEDVGTISIDSVPWRPLVNYTEVDTRPVGVVGLAQLRATFKSSRFISPIMALDDILFINFITATTGDYVSRNIDANESPFNKITLSFDRHTPAGASVTPYYSVDGGQTWRAFQSNPSIERQSAEFERVTYNERVSTNPTNKQLKLKLTLRGENRFIRPRARRLTCVMKDEIDN